MPTAADAKRVARNDSLLIIRISAAIILPPLPLLSALVVIVNDWIALFDLIND